MRSWDDGSDSILTVWDWLLLFPKRGRQLGVKDKIRAAMRWRATVSWMIGLFSVCLQSQAWNAAHYCNGLSTSSKVNHHTPGRKPECALRACNWSWRAQQPAIRMSVSMRLQRLPFGCPTCKAGLRAYCYVPRLPAQREQQLLNRVMSLLPPSHQNPNQNTPGKSVFTLYFLSSSQHEENTV